MTCPDHVRIAGRDYRTRRRSARAMPDACGQIHKEDGLIDIRRGQAHLEEVDTYLHEVFHGILYAQGRDPNDPHEETYVRALATGLIGVLRDNPQLAHYLASVPDIP